MFCAVKIVSAPLAFFLSLAPLMASDPGAVAMDFLGKVRKGMVDLEPGADTALLEHITERKRDSIRKRIERLKMELKGGELELGEVKEEGGFAAVMILKTGGFDSAEMQVFPVAMVKRGDKWLPAPVPASFENAVAGYTLPLKARLAALEGWMIRKRVTDLERLLTEAAKRTHDQIRDSIIGEDLEGDDLGKITDRFLEACVEADRAAILGFLGGLSDPLPTDWSARLKASKAAVAGQGNWWALVSSEVIRVRVHEERDLNDGMVSIAWLDPQTAATSGVRLTHLSFSRNTAGQWMIDLPESLLYGRKVSNNEDFDEDLRDRFTEKLREAEPGVHAESAREAEVVLMESLKTGVVRETMRLVDSGNHSRGDTTAIMEAAAVWWSVNEPGALRMPVELGFREEGTLAAAAYQWFSVNEPDRFALRTLYFRKTEKGWLWCAGTVPKGEKAAHDTLAKWLGKMEAGWRLSWRESLMQPSVRLDALDYGQPPSDDELKALLSAWLKALDRKDLSAALATVAWLGGQEEIPMKALRNICYELAHSSDTKVELAAIHRSGSLLAATIRRDLGERIQHTFIPIVTTPKGPRLLPEIDLIADDTRSRSFLNEASFERLGKSLGEDKLGDLKRLFKESGKEGK